MSHVWKDYFSETNCPNTCLDGIDVVYGIYWDKTYTFVEVGSAVDNMLSVVKEVKEGKENKHASFVEYGTTLDSNISEGRDGATGLNMFFRKPIGRLDFSRIGNGSCVARPHYAMYADKTLKGWVLIVLQATGKTTPIVVQDYVADVCKGIKAAGF